MSTAEAAAPHPPMARHAERRTLAVACGAHILHDGFSDLLYVVLPIWQAEFGLGYALIGMLRALYSAGMAGFQLPATRLAGRFGSRTMLLAGSLLASLSFALAGASTGAVLLAAALFLGGIGASVQHPIAADLVARAFAGKRSRGALASYNFAGDLGKTAFPALTAWLLVFLPWRTALLVIAVLGGAASLGILLLPGRGARGRLDGEPLATVAASVAPAGAGRGFPLLLAIGIIDTATRMGFMTFLPFLLTEKGAALPTIGLALALLFAGGAAGKLACGFVGQWLGVIATVCLTEGLTAIGILALLPMSLTPALAILPLIGIALNGTSSVLYGTVPELVPPAQRAHAFSLFYTGVIGMGAVAPILYGLVTDLADIPTMMILVSAIVLTTLPLALLLRPALAQRPRELGRASKM